MRQSIACIAILGLLAACSEPAEDTAADTMAADSEMAATDVDTMEDYVGSWDVVYADGSTGVTTNNPDGTYNLERADGTTETGTWTFGAEESCWTAAGSEEARCWQIGAPDATGMRTLTAEDGSQITVTPAGQDT